MSDIARSRLIALGSAAVVAVYAAGYDRTRVAASQFAGDDTHRRAPVQPASPTAVAATVPSAAAPDAPAPLTAAARAQAPVAITTVAAAAHAAPASVEHAPRAIDSAPPSTQPVVVAAKAVDTIAARAAEPAGESAHAVVAQWKDGSYSGWGTSRHGDIQATVVIADGRIASATIAQCLTRYSCSWISALPPQVVSRQSAEVDYVSGATQSTNAFYTAIVEALSKAK